MGRMPFQFYVHLPCLAAARTEAPFAAVQGKVSPAWESISAPRHLFLMFTSVSHSVTAYEVGHASQKCVIAFHL